jgi:hypothetical protein
VNAHRRVRVTLGCVGADCSGRLTLRRRGRAGTYASAAFHVPAGTIRTVALKVSRSTARRARRHRLAATLDAGGGIAVAVTLTR